MIGRNSTGGGRWKATASTVTTARTVIPRGPSDSVRTQTGQLVKAAVQQTRGPNRNVNHTLKRIFKGAATPMDQDR
jgi:hypothetical protein